MLFPSKWRQKTEPTEKDKTWVKEAISQLIKKKWLNPILNCENTPRERTGACYPVEWRNT